MKLDASTIFENPSTFRFEPSISPPRFSTSFDYRNASFESRNSSVDSRMSPFIENGSTCSSSSRIHIVLSTPSPSAFANGERVDKEINRLNKISETWRKYKDFDESDFNEKERSPPRVTYSTIATNITPDSKLFRKRKSTSRSRSTSPVNNAPCPVHSNRRSVSLDKERSRQSTPSRSSPKREERNGRKIRASQSPVAQGAPRQFRRSSSYDGNPTAYSDKRSRSPSPLSDIYRRSQSYSEQQKSQLFRPRNTSQGLNPSVGCSKINPYNNTELYYPKSRSLSSSREKVSLYRNIFTRDSSQEDDDSSDTLSLKSSISLSRDFFKNENKFSTFPRRRHARKGRPPVDRNLFDNKSPPENYLPRSSPTKEIRGVKQYSSYSNPAPKYTQENNYSQQSPDYSNRMSSSPRKLSEENSLSRGPLATLHEDGCSAGIYTDYREKSADRDFLDDYYNEQRKLSEAGVRKLSGIDASIVLTEDTDSFIIGDRVWVGGTKPGKISFIGETKFAPGDWAGVTLDDAIGKNDGSVGSYRYFQCEPRKGVFSRLTRLTRIPLMMANAGHMGTDLDFIADSPSEYSRSSYSPARRQSPSYESPKRASPAPVDKKPSEPARKTSPFSARNGSAGNARRGSSPLSTSSSEVRVGDSVVITSTAGTKRGVLRFIGKTEFADGLWGGVELDEASGNNDGSMAGKKYGIFAPLVRISRMSRLSPSRTTPTRTYGKDTSRASPSYREAPKYGTGAPSKPYKGREANSSFDADIFFE